jgi:hypothetical protein
MELGGRKLTKAMMRQGSQETGCSAPTDNLIFVELAMTVIWEGMAGDSRRV